MITAEYDLSTDCFRVKPQDMTELLVCGLPLAVDIITRGLEREKKRAIEIAEEAK